MACRDLRRGLEVTATVKNAVSVRARARCTEHKLEPAQPRNTSLASTGRPFDPAVSVGTCRHRAGSWFVRINIIPAAAPHSGLTFAPHFLPPLSILLWNLNAETCTALQKVLVAAGQTSGIHSRRSHGDSDKSPKMQQ